MNDLPTRPRIAAPRPRWRRTPLHAALRLAARLALAGVLWAARLASLPASSSAAGADVADVATHDAKAAAVVHDLARAPAPLDNPLKGLVPYSGPKPAARFPYSLEFNYLSLADLMIGPTNFDWTPLERLLDDVASRGRQAIFRVWMEYPRKRPGIPRFLIDAGVKVHRYTNTNTQPFPPAPVSTPDYEDPRLRQALTRFIQALGGRYDGDPRIGFVTAGLLGTWGEWHTHPRSDLWASPEVQTEVMDAYEAAFHTTPVLLRYPAGPDTRDYADNAGRRFGYHDDSFAFATLHTGRERDRWFFESRLRASGDGAWNKWRTQPIGGEIRPEVWTCLWDDPPCTPPGQDFAACVEATHVSWLMDSGTIGGPAFNRPLTPAHLARATNAVRRLGYELQVAQVRFDPAEGMPTPTVTLSVTNHGVAPFYQPWRVELARRDSNGSLSVWPTDIDLRRTPPGEAIVWRIAPRGPGARVSPPEAPPAAPPLLLLRVVNPLPGGRTFRFANADQDAHVPGWLTLGPLPGL